jgi:hypothetical protein
VGGGLSLGYEQFAEDADTGTFYNIGVTAAGLSVDFRQNFIYNYTYEDSAGNEFARQNKWGNFDIVIGYEKEDVFAAEIEIETGSKKWKSFLLTPSFEVYLGKITVVGEVVIYALGDDFSDNAGNTYPLAYDEDNLKPTYDAKIGVKYSF